MATTLDTILVEFGAQWTGGGAVNRLITDISRVSRATKELYNPVVATGLVKDMGSVSTAFAHGAAEALKLQAAIKGNEQKLVQLGRALAGIDTDKKLNPFAGMSLDEGAKKYQQIAIESNKFKQELSQISTQAGGTTSAVNRFVTALAPVVVVAGAAAGALYLGVKAFNAFRAAAEEGAAIRQTARSFEYLTESVYRAPGLLDQLRLAARGTISDLDLMSSYLTMISGTTPEFGASMSAAAPQILEIAKAASTLNPTLGDTTFFFESLARGLKRTEYRLIDNLGLNVRVGEANRRYAESLGKTVQELTAMERQQAFLNEVLRVGGQLIAQLGGNLDSLTDPYQQFSANIENMTNSLKEFASVSFAPLMSEMANMTSVWQEMIQTVISGTHGVNSGTVDIQENIDAFMSGITSAITHSGMIGQFVGLVELATDAVDRFNEAVNRARTGHSFWEVVGTQDIHSAPLIDATAMSVEEYNQAVENLKPPRTGEINAAFEGIEQAVDNARIAVERYGAAATSADTAMIGSANMTMMFRDPEKYGSPSRKAWLASVVKKEEAAALQAFREMRASMMNEQRQLQAAMYAGWAAIEAERNQGVSNSWLDIFSGGELESDYIIGSIKNIGWAMVQTGGAVQQHGERWEELNKQYERAKEKLWALQHGIGTQGDKTEAVTKRIADQAAEVANYERILGELTTTIGSQPVTTERRWAGLNLDDMAIFKQFIQIAGQSGSPAAQLSQMGVAMGIFGEETGDAMQKVALIDTVLGNLNLDLQAGKVDASEIPGAIADVIAMLEQNMPIQKIRVAVQAEVGFAQAEVTRELRLPEEDRTREIDVGANMTPAMRALAEGMGIIRRSEDSVTIDANDQPARNVLSSLRSDIENTTLYIDIHGRYTAPDNMPTSSTSTTTPNQIGQTHTPNSLPPGFIKNLDALGAPVTSAGRAGGGNSVSLQNYFYAPVGMSAAREVIVRASDDAAAQLVDVLKRNGYKI